MLFHLSVDRHLLCKHLFSVLFLVLLQDLVDAVVTFLSDLRQPQVQLDNCAVFFHPFLQLFASILRCANQTIQVEQHQKVSKPRSLLSVLDICLHILCLSFSSAISRCIAIQHNYGTMQCNATLCSTYLYSTVKNNTMNVLQHNAT